MADGRLVGDILADRRSQLNISLDRAASETKLRRSVIEAFENNDFEAMPPRGYAQASLASYARYLGIPASEIVPVFQRQLDSYERVHGKRQIGETGSFSVRASDRTPPARGARRTAPNGAGRLSDQVSSRERRDSARTVGSEAGRSRQYPSSYETGRPRRDVRDMYDYGSTRARQSSQAGRHDDARPSDYLAPDRRDGQYRPSPPGHRSPEPTQRRSSYASDGPRRGLPDIDRHGTPPATDRSEADWRRDEAWSYRPSSMRRQSTRQTHAVDLDDGYFGGSGSITGSIAVGTEPSAPSRQPANTPDRITVAEIAGGFLDFFRSNRYVTVVIVGAVSIVLLAVACIGVSSCSRNMSNYQGDETLSVEVVDDSAQPEAASGDTGAIAQLAESIDLNAVPTGSTITLAVDGDAPAGPWVEAYVDDAAAGASIADRGSTLEWTLARTARVLLSTTEGVHLSVNGVAVNPSYDNGTYVLNVNVPQDQWPVAVSENPAAEDGSADNPAPEGEQEQEEEYSAYEEDDQTDW